MTVTISMPQLGLTMTEGTVGAWFKKPGDLVKKDEAILSVSTDKVDMDVESTVDGILQEIIVDQGQTVPVGTALAYVAVTGDENDSALSLASDPATLPLKDTSTGAPAAPENSIAPATQAATGEPASRSERLRVSPRAKRQAERLGVDIGSVKGSGPNGRIIESDLPKIAVGRSTPTTTHSDSKRRQALADRMVESVRTIPAFSVSLEVNAEKLVLLYRSLRESADRQIEIKPTYTDLLLRVLALSLAETPEMNAVWEDGTVRRRTRIDLGFAVATERGVVAPVLADLAKVPLKELALRRTKIADKARQSRLTFADLEGGVGTLSNLGMYRVDRFEGMITPGQSFILAAGKLRERPWVDTSLVVKPTLILTVSVDHRMADGAAAAIFLESMAGLIENPHRLVENE